MTSSSTGARPSPRSAVTCRSPAADFPLLRDGRCFQQFLRASLLFRLQLRRQRYLLLFQLPRQLHLRLGQLSLFRRHFLNARARFLLERLALLLNFAAALTRFGQQRLDPGFDLLGQFVAAEQRFGLTDDALQLLQARLQGAGL